MGAGGDCLIGLTLNTLVDSVARWTGPMFQSSYRSAILLRIASPNADAMTAREARPTEASLPVRNK